MVTLMFIVGEMLIIKGRKDIVSILKVPLRLGWRCQKYLMGSRIKPRSSIIITPMIYLSPSKVKVFHNATAQIQILNALALYQGGDAKLSNSV